MTKKELSNESKKYLKSLISEDSKLIISIKSVSKSGMSRRMRVYTQNLTDITQDVARLIEASTNDKGLLVTGCGMDMTFWLANTITYYLFDNKKSIAFKGNGGNCLDWKVI